MDQIKIGSFIAERRKKAGLTQAALAEQLNITDKAVSKWECGRALPDSAMMMPLCEILGINVTELLSGEVVAAEEQGREMEQKLLEMVRQKEESDRRMLMFEVVIGVLSCIVLFAPIFVAALLPMKDWLRIVLCFSGFIPGVAGFGFALRIEQVAGYYECRHCKHRYVPTYKAVSAAPHMARTRYMKCPECGKKSWQIKVVEKDGE